MTDFTFVGMIIGIIVIGVGVIGYLIFGISFSIKSIVSEIIDAHEIKTTSYYSMDKSPPGFFKSYVKKYTFDLLLEDYHLVKPGYIRYAVEHRMFVSPNKSEDRHLVATILASQKEIENGFRPTVYPKGYLKTTNDLWDLIKIKFHAEYDDVVMRYPNNEDVLIKGQKNDDARWKRKHGEYKESAEAFI